MRLARLKAAGEDAPRVAVASDSAAGDWFDVRTAAEEVLNGRGASTSRARGMAAALVPPSMSQALANGEAFWDLAKEAVVVQPERALVPHPVFSAAVDAVAFRDFMVFERHFSFGYEWRGLPVPDVMYEFPVSYAGEPRSFRGPGDLIPWPSYTSHLDYELELGIVISREGINLWPEQALEYVAGLVILNDVSARDIQVREMAGGLGPSKGKHFASMLGPWLATLDSLPAEGLRMQARVNGETWCDASSSDMVWSVAEVVAWASQGERLEPGMLLGTGTCNGGSTIEAGKRLKPGDSVEFDVECLGTLRNTIAAPDPAGWVPRPRRRGPAGSTEETHFLS